MGRFGQGRRCDPFALYAEETRSVNRLVCLPPPVPLREFIAQELFKVVIRVARPMSLEIAAVASRGVRAPIANG